jgi:hypothetical protein
VIRSTTRTRRTVAGLLAVLLTVSGLALLGGTSASASPSSMLGSVNASRANAGLPAYTWNSHLASVAAEQARRMAKQTKLYHNPNLASDVGDYRWVGENVGYGPSTGVIQNAFMKSPAHKANILDDNFTQIGIAEVRDTKGRLWVAQVFRQPSGATAPKTTTTKKKQPKASEPKTTKQRSSKPKAPAPKPTRTPKATRSTGSSGDAQAPATTRTPRPTPTATPTPTPTSTPSAGPTLSERVQQAIAASPAPTGDPLADTFAFATTMSDIAG